MDANKENNRIKVLDTRKPPGLATRKLNLSRSGVLMILLKYHFKDGGEFSLSKIPALKYIL